MHFVVVVIFPHFLTLCINLISRLVICYQFRVMLTHIKRKVLLLMMLYILNRANFIITLLSKVLSNSITVSLLMVSPLI